MEANLLDLPSLVLEKIFLYCLKTEYDPEDFDDFQLRKLLTINKFIGDFISNNPRLMENLTLKIDLTRYQRNVNEDKEILKACLESSRKYTKISLAVRDVNRMWALEDSITNFKALFDKHASRIQTVEIDSFFNYAGCAWKIFSTLESLQNMKILDLFFDNGDSFRNMNSESSLPEYGFDKLSDLTIGSYLNSNVSNVFIHVFKNCRNIEKIVLKNEVENTSSLQLLLENCCESLKDLRLGKKTNCLQLLATMNLDLTYLDYGCDLKTEEDVGTFMSFVGSQVNLKKLKIYILATSSTIVSSFVKFGDILCKLKNLKHLAVYLKFTEDSSALEESDLKNWNLCNLEYLKLAIDKKSCPHLVKRIFEIPSNNLNELYVNIDFGQVDFDKMINNFRLLSRLYLSISCTSYDSNDIFKILRNLKQLKYLQFAFPLDNPLNVSLLYLQEDLVLPNIQHVEFYLNNSITTDILTELAKFIKNVSTLCLYTENCQHFHHYTALDSLTQKLPNLTDLSFAPSLENLEDFFWQHIQLNLKKFNKNPHLFKLNRPSIAIIDYEIRGYNCDLYAFQFFD